MQLAMALGLLIIATVYSVKLTRETAMFQNVILATSLMWPVAVVLYNPLLNLRNFIWVALGGMAIWWLLYCQRPVLRYSWPLFVLFGYMMIASLWAVNSIDSAMRTTGISLMMIYAVAQIWTRPTKQAISQIFDTLTVVSFGIMIIFINSAILHGISFSQRFSVGTLRATGVADFALTALIIFGGRGFKEKGAKRLVLLTLSTLAFVFLVFTKSREPLFASIGVIGFMAIFSRKMQRRTWDIVFYLMSLSLALLVLFGIPASNIASQFRLTTKTGALYNVDELVASSGRLDRWTNAMKKAGEHPFLGRGTGSSTFYVFPDWVLASSTNTTELPYHTVHNQYVETYYDHGIVGLGLLIFILVWITWIAVKSFQYPPPDIGMEVKTLALLWLTVPIGMLGHGGYFSSGNPARMWVWMAGLVLVYLHQYNGSRDHITSDLLQHSYRKLNEKPLRNYTR